MSLALLVAFFAGSGIAVMGLVQAPLRFEERVAVAVTAAVILDTAVCFLMSLVVGLNPAVILAAPLLVMSLAGATGWRLGGIGGPWRASWAEVANDSARRRSLIGLLGVVVVVAVASFTLFGRAMSLDGGSLVTGYWLPDWSQHLITASTFSVANNLPPQNPIFSGTPLDYPFLPDLTSAMLMRLGLGPGLALALPQALLCVVIALLIITLAERLGARRGVGIIAVAICFLGGGAGFLGAFEDACTSGGYSPAQCSVGHVLTHPIDGLGITAASLHNLPSVVTAQPRAYDGLPSLEPAGVSPLVQNQQWYTPFFGWWMPQRSMVFGFATVLAVLTVLLTAMAGAAPRLIDLALAGGLAGLLPLTHVHSLFAVVIVSAGLALSRWRRAWLFVAAITAVVAAPRMLQLAAAPHGTAALGNQYPWLEPGWLSQAIDNTALPKSFDVATMLAAVGDWLRLPFSGKFWGFWLVNLGVAVPLCAVFVLAATARALARRRQPTPIDAVVAAAASASEAHGSDAHTPSSSRLRVTASVNAVHHVSDRICAVVPAPLLRFCLCVMPIFAIANLVVFQSWDWDNTKLFAYWYLGAALLIGALAVHWWRGLWRGALAVLLAGSVLATGSLVVLRLIPFHPPCGASVTPGCYANSITGPYTLVAGGDLSMADAVIGATAPGAVFLTTARFNDPIPVITGRPVVMGYDGWLWSYGIDYSQRKQDVATAYAGCGSTRLSQCQQILDILQRYGISYVEVDSASAEPKVDAGWWGAQGLPVIARSDHIVVYDVRRP